MPDLKLESLASSQRYQMALSRWDNEGGAGPCGSRGGQISAEAQSEAPELTNAELVQLRVRVIALENLVISLLTEAPDRQLDLARNGGFYLTKTGLHPSSSHDPCGSPDDRSCRPSGPFSGRETRMNITTASQRRGCAIDAPQNSMKTSCRLDHPCHRTEANAWPTPAV